jgi:hypothetical protein
MRRLFVHLFSLLRLLFAFVNKNGTMLLEQLHDLVFVMSLGKLERIHALLVKPSKVDTLFNQKFNCFEATLFDCVKEWSLSVSVYYISISTKVNQFFCRLIVSFSDAVKYRSLTVSV